MLRKLAFLLFLTPVTLAGPKVLDKDAAGGLVRLYRDADNWALKGIILLGLGARWHPEAAEIVRASLAQRDVRLRCFALEALHRTDDYGLAQVMTAPLLDEIIAKHLSTGGSKKYYGARMRGVLARLFPEMKDAKPKAWATWWEERRDTYQPARWVDPPPKSGARRTIAAPFFKRAFDLQKAGMDMVIVIDSTGSMQRTIDLARDALDEIVTVIRGIAPRFRVGLVHYRDLDDMRNGAAILSKLTASHSSVKKKLARLQAEGGGDLPERVELGLALAFDRRMGWIKNANKTVILIGDAPPHAGSVLKAIQLADSAYKNPGGTSGTTPTSPRKKLRPFVTSAIAVGTMAEPTFRRIAKAGGGAFAKLKGSNTRGTDTIVRRILTLSFGARWSKQIGSFLLVYRKYRNQGVYKN